MKESNIGRTCHAGRAKLVEFLVCCVQLELMDSWTDTESAKYKRLMMLAAETSSPSRVVTDATHDTSHPGPFCQSSEDEDGRKSLPGISRDGNEVGKNAVQHEVVLENCCSIDTVDDFGIRANGPSSKESTCEMQSAGGTTAFTERAGVENHRIATNVSKAGDLLDKLDRDSCVGQFSDQSLPRNTGDIISDTSDVNFGYTNHSTNDDGQIDHANHVGQALSPAVDHMVVLTSQSDGMVRGGLVDETDHSANYDDQTVGSFDQTGHSIDHDGQTLCHVSHTNHCTNGDGHIDQANHSDDHVGQALSPAVDHVVELTSQSDGMVRGDLVHDTVHSANYDDQTVGLFDQTGHSVDHNGPSQTLCHVDHTNHPTDDDGQIDQTNHSDDHVGQALSPAVDHMVVLTNQSDGMVRGGLVDDTIHSANYDDQTVRLFDQTGHSVNHDGQTLCHVDHTNHSTDDDGQIDQTNHSDDHVGQALSPAVDHIVVLTRGMSDGMVRGDLVDDTVHSANCLFDQTGHSIDHDGQTLCHVDQVVMLTKLPGRSTTVVRPVDHRNGQDGEERCPVDQTGHPPHHDGQALSS